MKNILLRFLFLQASLATSLISTARDLLQYVDPEVGTAHSRWFYYTPAAVPRAWPSWRHLPTATTVTPAAGKQ
ncbi:hypothetical protein ACQ86N_02910 [Puia sp. P3]|uniref:hypothetical protein n=1 Tax=Puia sp. P3 TaxID=3423952 RepID=UPI003D66755D